MRLPRPSHWIRSEQTEQTQPSGRHCHGQEWGSPDSRQPRQAAITGGWEPTWPPGGWEPTCALSVVCRPSTTIYQIDGGQQRGATSNFGLSLARPTQTPDAAYCLAPSTKVASTGGPYSFPNMAKQGRRAVAPYNTSQRGCVCMGGTVCQVKAGQSSASDVAHGSETRRKCDVVGE